MAGTLDILSDAEYAGGTHLTRVRGWSSLVFGDSTDGSSGASLSLPADHGALSLLSINSVMKIVHAGEPYEYRIMTIEDTLDAEKPEVIISASPLIHDLGFLFFRQTIAGIPSYSLAGSLLTPTEWLDDFFLPSLVEQGITHYERGNVTPVSLRSMEWDGESLLSWLWRLIARDGVEPSLRRNTGTSKMAIDLVAKGASADQSLCWVGRNVVSLDRHITREGMATSVRPTAPAQTGALERDSAAWVEWDVIGMTDPGSGRKTYTLRNPDGKTDIPPFDMDDEVNGLTVRSLCRDWLMPFSYYAGFYTVQHNMTAAMPAWYKHSGETGLFQYRGLLLYPESSFTDDSVVTWRMPRILGPGTPQERATIAANFGTCYGLPVVDYGANEAAGRVWWVVAVGAAYRFLGMHPSASSSSTFYLGTVDAPASVDDESHFAYRPSSTTLYATSRQSDSKLCSVDVSSVGNTWNEFTHDGTSLNGLAIYYHPTKDRLYFLTSDLKLRVWDPNTDTEEVALALDLTSVFANAGLHQMDMVIQPTAYTNGLVVMGYSAVAGFKIAVVKLDGVSTGSTPILEDDLVEGSQINLSAHTISDPGATGATTYEYLGGDATQWKCNPTGDPSGAARASASTTAALARINAVIGDNNLRITTPMYRAAVESSVCGHGIAVYVPDTALGSWSGYDYLRIEMTALSGGTQGDLTVAHINGATGGDVTLLDTAASLDFALSTQYDLMVELDDDEIRVYWDGVLVITTTLTAELLGGTGSPITDLKDGAHRHVALYGLNNQNSGRVTHRSINIDDISPAVGPEYVTASAEWYPVGTTPTFAGAFYYSPSIDRLLFSYRMRDGDGSLIPYTYHGDVQSWQVTYDGSTYTIAQTEEHRLGFSSIAAVRYPQRFCEIEGVTYGFSKDGEAWAFAAPDGNYLSRSIYDSAATGPTITTDPKFPEAYVNNYDTEDTLQNGRLRIAAADGSLLTELDDPAAIALYGRIVREVRSEDYFDDPRTGAVNLLENGALTRWNTVVTNNPKYQYSPLGFSIPDNIDEWQPMIDTSLLPAETTVTYAILITYGGAYSNSVSVKLSTGGPLVLYPGDLLHHVSPLLQVMVTKQVTINSSTYTTVKVARCDQNSTITTSAGTAYTFNRSAMKLWAEDRKILPVGLADPTGDLVSTQVYWQYGAARCEFNITLPSPLPPGTKLFVGGEFGLWGYTNQTIPDPYIFIKCYDTPNDFASPLFSVQADAASSGFPTAGLQGALYTTIAESSLVLVSGRKTLRCCFSSDTYPLYVKSVWAYVAFESKASLMALGYGAGAGAYELYHLGRTIRQERSAPQVSYTVQSIEDRPDVPYVTGGMTRLVDPSRGIGVTKRILSVERMVSADGTGDELPVLKIENRESELTRRLIESGIF